MVLKGLKRLKIGNQAKGRDMLRKMRFKKEKAKEIGLTYNRKVVGDTINYTVTVDKKTSKKRIQEIVGKLLDEIKENEQIEGVKLGKKRGRKNE